MVEYHGRDYLVEELRGKVSWFVSSGYDLWPCNRDEAIRCPYGFPGDRLWVKEQYAIDSGGLLHHDKSKWDIKPELEWKSPRFMPKWASRILLEIVSVRVERLQDISFNDWVADFCPTLVEQEKARASFTGADNQRKMAASFWDSINAKRGYSWESNPWVWVIEFKKSEAGDEQKQY